MLRCGEIITQVLMVSSGGTAQLSTITYQLLAISNLLPFIDQPVR